MLLNSLARPQYQFLHRRHVLFKIDENLPGTVRDLLVAAGYDACTVLDQKLGGTSDPELAKVCTQEGRILVSLDLGFADIRSYPPREHPGMVVFRPARQDVASVCVLVQHMISAFENATPERKLWIVEEQRIRIRE